ncbi:MAG: chemotaxis protein CheD [Thermodesulfovibrio sp.]|nr:chemotaxis protein CheD [Thermodesulfovibrio sp.]
MENYFLLPGNIYLTNNSTYIVTILGSCVAVCLWDEETKMGGMNHYLLPLWNGEGVPTPKYGNVAIPKLIGKFQDRGIEPKRLKAKIFGGANLLSGQNKEKISLIGERNIEIALEMLEKYKIPIISYDVGGNTGRKIIMNTYNFEIRLKRIGKEMS